MGLIDFNKKQFIDIILWTEKSDGTLAWLLPMMNVVRVPPTGQGREAKAWETERSRADAFPLF